MTRQPDLAETLAAETVTAALRMQRLLQLDGQLRVILCSGLQLGQLLTACQFCSFFHAASQAKSVFYAACIVMKKENQVCHVQNEGED